MAKGSKSTNQLEKLLKKFRLTNHKDDNVRALNTEMANELSIEMKLPHKGYCKDASKLYYGRIGYNIYNGDFSPNMKKMIDFYDFYKTQIELYGFIQHIIVEKLPNDRKNFIKDVMRFLDNVLTDFIEKASDSFKNAKYSAMRERSVGLGVMGLHSYFQKNMIPFESVMSKVWNNKIFKNIHEKKVGHKKRS